MPDPTRQFFTATPESVGQARDFALTTLSSWGLSARAEDIRLCVSELASNALAHGTAPGHGFLVKIEADDDFVRLEVHDSRGRRPAVRHPTDTDTSGRGLLIVEALSDGWGVEDRRPFGKIVWSRFKAGGDTMLTRSAAPAFTTSGPGPGLLVSLGAWTWPGTDPVGAGIAHILLAHPPGRTSHDTAEAIEARMRHTAESLGGLAGARESIPDLYGRLRVIGDRVLLRFHSTRYGLWLPAHPTWTELVTGRGKAVLLIGLDPLPQSADAARVDAFLDAALAADRLLFGLARIT